MSVKSHAKKSGNVAASWLKKREEVSRKKIEDKTVVDYFERQTEEGRKNGIGNITARLKETGLKLKNTVKAKLVDDEKTTEYTVINIDKRGGIITLKNERGTVRKVSMFDSVFNPK